LCEKVIDLAVFHRDAAICCPSAPESMCVLTSSLVFGNRVHERLLHLKIRLSSQVWGLALEEADKVCGVGEGDSGGDGAPTRELREAMLVRQ